MHVKRLLFGSILYSYIALCLGEGSLELEGAGFGGRTIELEPYDEPARARVIDINEIGGEEFTIDETIKVEEGKTTTITNEELAGGIDIDRTVTLDETKKVEIDENLEEKVAIDKVVEVKKPKKVKKVKEETVVVEKEPKIDHKVISDAGSKDKFIGKEIVEKQDEVESREFFFDNALLVKESDVDYRNNIFKIYGEDKGDKIEEVTELEDEDRFGDGTLAQLLDEFLLDPLDAILELLKQTLRSVVANLDHILESVFKVVAALLNVVLVLVLDILILVVHVLADLIPGVFGKSFNKYDGYVTECVEKVKMDPITTSLIELEQCVTDPLFHIVEDVIIILTDVQQILGEIDQGLRQLEVVRKAEEALTDVVAIVLDVVERVLETVEDLVEGPVADILVLIPVLLACILGDIGKNLLGGLLNLLKKYVACTTYADFFDFNTVVKSLTFWE